MSIRICSVLLLAALAGCATGIDRSGYPADSIGGNSDIPLAPLMKNYPQRVIDAALETPYKYYVHVHGTVRERRVTNPEVVRSSGSDSFDSDMRERLAGKYFPGLSASGHRRPAVSIHAVRYEASDAPGGHNVIVLTKIHQPLQQSRSMPTGGM